MAVSKRLRFEILRRDNFTCRYCGLSAPAVHLRVDHVVPDVLGGKPEPGNLVTACEPCNSGKSSMHPDSPLVENVQQDAIRWKRAMEEAAQIRRYKREEREAYSNYFLALWNEWDYGPVGGKKRIPLADDWRSTLDLFFEYDVEADDIVFAVRTAMERKNVLPEHTFRYFCGICWNMLRDAQKTAADIVMAEISDEVNASFEDGL